MCRHEPIISIFHQTKSRLTKFVFYLSIICISSVEATAQKKNIEFSVGTIVDTTFFNKVDSMVNLNKFKNDPIFYLHILKKHDSKWGPVVHNIEFVKDLTDTIYIYVSPKQTIYDKMYLDYVMVAYSGRLYALPRICENYLFKIVGTKEFIYDHKVEMEDLDNNFFKKQWNVQLLHYANGNISEEPKTSTIYRAAKE